MNDVRRLLDGICKLDLSSGYICPVCKRMHKIINDYTNVIVCDNVNKKSTNLYLDNHLRLYCEDCDCEMMPVDLGVYDPVKFLNIDGYIETCYSCAGHVESFDGNDDVCNQYESQDKFVRSCYIDFICNDEVLDVVRKVVTKIGSIVKDGYRVQFLNPTSRYGGAYDGKALREISISYLTPYYKWVFAEKDIYDTLTVDEVEDADNAIKYMNTMMLLLSHQIREGIYDVIKGN